ncbi:MAG: glutamate--tRNA ligase [Candidatus Moduliflexus flocculans]|nr:glutamate--tRNA ligase [Candidatus Moduliflexus flocculans]
MRFASSPTGHLHIGGARTALFNWLFARHHGGIFILRIEDTDRSRSTEEFIDAIIDGMRWLKLDWDEGPFRQTDRFDVYRNYASRLLDEGRAYRCYCSHGELERRRQEALAQGRTPKYDGRCRDLSAPVAGVEPAVRFKMPQEGSTVIDDLIKGPIEFDNNQLEDLVIMRSDGTPTYNFVVVVDDIDMRITHIIEGRRPPEQHPQADPHLPGLRLGAPSVRAPADDPRRRQGKAQQAPRRTSVMAYRDMGYLPDALVNYLVRLGWSYGDQEVFTKEELIRHFSLDSVEEIGSGLQPREAPLAKRTVHDRI